jgi:hypothetical protein
MSLLEELIGQPLDKIDDSELDELIMKGRLAREQRAPNKEKAVKKVSTAAASKMSEIDFDAFE